MSEPELFQGEDSVQARCPAGLDIQALAAAMRSSGYWEEVIPGMTDLTVKYDPGTMSGGEAAARFCRIWDAPLPINGENANSIILDADFTDAPDAALVAEALGRGVNDLPQWLFSRQYRVAMMGFQPGFAYLEDVSEGELPVIPRLATPRQQVSAGSIGFLGKRVCIYALDGPGGWPIIGQVNQALFRPQDPQPFLLQPGLRLSFRTR